MTVPLLTIEDIATATGGRAVGGPPPIGPVSISTDTRRLQPGEVFLALVGPSFDGHDFVTDARQAGAAGAIVSRPAAGDGYQLVVPDTLAALGQIAAAHRARFSRPVVAVTGSTGKTTTKELLCAILEQRGPVLRTARNENNEVGVPLTALRLSAEHTAAVFELGMRAPGEIRYLAEIVAPTVAVITNIGHSHLERLGTVEAIADAKAEVLEALPADGTAVLNLDDDQFPRLLAAARGQALPFSIMGTGAPVHCRQVEVAEDQTWRFVLCTPWGETKVALGLPGRHNVWNALAAAAAGLAAGATLDQVAAGLAQPLELHNRLRLRAAAGGAMVIDDCYNASPSSMRAALALLKGMPAERKVAVLGDMKELGPTAADLHRQVGAEAAASGVTRLIAYGPLARHYAAGTGALPGGVDCTEDRAEAARLAKAELAPGTVVLVKGSRAMAMEEIVEQLLT